MRYYHAYPPDSGIYLNTSGLIEYFELMGTFEEKAKRIVTVIHRGGYVIVDHGEGLGIGQPVWDSARIGRWVTVAGKLREAVGHGPYLDKLVIVAPDVWGNTKKTLRVQEKFQYEIAKSPLTRTGTFMWVVHNEFREAHGIIPHDRAIIAVPYKNPNCTTPIENIQRRILITEQIKETPARNNPIHWLGMHSWLEFYLGNNMNVVSIDSRKAIRLKAIKGFNRHKIMLDLARFKTPEKSPKSEATVKLFQELSAGLGIHRRGV